jgi:hypothetical protein
VSTTNTRRIRVNNVSYEVRTVDGVDVYDPPLPESTRNWFDRSKQDIRDGSCPKMGKCDTKFHQGRKTIREQFQDDLPWLNRFSREYRKQTGRDLNPNAVWLGQVADSPFDAKGVIDPSMGQGDVDRLVNRKLDQMKKEAEAPPVKLAEDLVQGKMREYREKGDTAPADELRHKVIEKHGRKD